MLIEKPELLPDEFRIFYSWQCQSPRTLNYNFIPASLRTAISKIESELPEEINCSIKVERDTSDRTGSPEIATTILDKVKRSHLFVGDVTIVHNEDTRGYCNNNVLIELGYAAGTIGWDRVACVCNTAYGDVESLPFDIRGRRIIRYNFPIAGDKKNASSQLDRGLYVAIESLMEAMGRGDLKIEMDQNAVKRQRDLQILTHILRNIHRPTFDLFFNGLREYKFLRDFHFFYDGLAPVVNSNRFQFYDKKLKELILGFCKPLGEGNTEGSYIFGPGNNPEYFTIDQTISGGEMEKVRPVLNLLFTAQQKLNEFLDYVHEYYPEIDLDETDREAWEENEPYICGTILHNRESDAGSSEDASK